ncbi:MAG: aspartyl-tRNA(Asn)/glutamyl-tRNA(Gln) amidotransferase subunit [Gaiellales bacterium]|nr:aspartyl-tRNA(Asn)/glutamyl-tRNA(Gln) amidotransferase subunit [Gaiellales bacterium]
MDELHTWPARRIAAAVAAGELSAEEVTRHHLHRIAEYEHLQTVITVTRDSALERARENLAGPLAGVPLLVKDILDTAGVRTTYGSGIFRDNVPLRSATSVRRLVDAGAIILGKANLHEFAWGVTSRNRAYGAVVNSARPDRIPGGSSGGNASALAAGLCALGLGTDTGASIRLPAAACGVAGFKPAFGSVPADGLWPLAPSFDHVGPLARSIDDCALAFDVLRGAPLPAVDPGGLRVRRLEPADVAATTEAFLEAAGLPAAPPFVRLHLAEVAEVHRETYAVHREAYDDDLHAKMAVGFAVSPGERAELVTALHAWRAASAAGCEWDVLVSPAFPGDLPPADVPATIELTDRMTAYTRPVNWLGWPSAVTADGLMHTGLDEAAVLAHARAWEAS